MALNLKVKARPTSTEIELPSGGFPYGGKFPAGKITVKPFTWETENLLYTADRNQVRHRMAEVLRRIAILPEGFNPTSFIEGDYEYILLTSRAMSYGETLTVNTECPECGHKESVEVKVPSHLVANRYTEDVARDTEGLIPFTTPDGNDVLLKFPTLEDEIQVDSILRNKIAAKVLAADKYTPEFQRTLFSTCVVKVNGDAANRQEVLQWLSTSLSERDAIEAFLISIRPGVQKIIKMQCDKCEHTYDVPVDLDELFFRHRRGPAGGQLPRGVRLGVAGKDALSEVDVGTGTPNVPGSV